MDVDRPPLLDDGLSDSPNGEIFSEDISESGASEPASYECRISPLLSGIFKDTVLFSATVDEAMTQNIKLDTSSLYENVFSLYNRLLTCQSDKMSGCDDSLRVCLILYIKSIVSSERLNVSSMNLVRKLQVSIQDCLHSSAPLAKWKLFIGGMAATDGTSEQQWFLQHLAATTAQNSMVGEDGWKSLQAELSDILWAKPIHEIAGHKLWLQIKGLRPT